MTAPRTAKVPFGGDYNPEQWPEEVWTEDYRLFDAAHMDTVTLGVFTWALTQPGPDVYDFTVLDRIVERAAAAGRDICLATGTGAHPAWLARAFRAEAVEVAAPGGGVDLLSGVRFSPGPPIGLDPYGVVVLREDRGGG